MNPVITDPARASDDTGRTGPHPKPASARRRAQHAGNNPAGQKAGVDADDEELELT